MRVPRQTRSRSLVSIAVIMLLFFCGTLTASFGVASLLLPKSNPASSTFAAVMPPTEATVTCLCVSCAAHNGGTEKCCCADANSASETMAFRAVCDVPLDAVIQGSLLPPIVLPQTVDARTPLICPSLLASRLSAAGHRLDNDSPLPPDAPPRLS